MTTKRAKRKREPIYMRVEKGRMEPASAYYAELLRARKFSVGDVVRVEITKPRNPGHHAKVMKLLGKVAELLDTTTDSMLIMVKIRLGMVDAIIDSSTGRTHYVVQSIDFENMDEGEFNVFHRKLSQLVARVWLPTMTPEQVEGLGSMLDEA